MTSHTTINIDILIAKLNYEIARAGGKTYVPPVTAALLKMAVRALEQQQAQLAALQGEHVGLAVATEA